MRCGMKSDIEMALSVLTEGINLDPDDDVMKDLNTLFKSMKSNNVSNVDTTYNILCGEYIFIDTKVSNILFSIGIIF